ncbi:MAG: hypothetical protein Q8S39_07730, partial [Ignavibacteria bacterium]|nr:hypothetical protein [Ignavibacteria bacterium]
RAPQFYSLYPMKFELKARFTPTAVSVNGNLSYQKNVEIDKIDATLPYDRQIDNVINSQLGITVNRKIFQFAQQYNDNYIVYEYTFTNTGNTDSDSEIELPNNTIKDAYFWFTFRNSVNKSVRYVVGNAAGWGINTMNDTRGDGVKTDPANEKYRATFSWHGYFPGKDVTYDNIGGPIWALNSTAAPFNDKQDTIGRLGGAQFLGTVTLYADKSATEKVDDPGQPKTTDYANSDHPLLLAGANALNKDRMTQEYALMSSGHKTPRHADAVEPSGDFVNQKNAPNVGNASGGISYNTGYGPYTLKPGESVRIVVAEAMNGIGRKLQVDTGIKYKKGQITAEAKNRIVFQGRDSLFLTFKRATEAFKADWKIPQPPMPPTSFDVNSGGDRISLKWDVAATDPNPPASFRIYRALGNVDSNYTVIYETKNASERTYDDKTVTRGFNYFYYITAVGAATAAGPGTPAGKLESGRYYTQTYDPANLQRQAGDKLTDIRIVPNPFNASAGAKVRFPGTLDEDKIAFYNIPGECTIRIYSELGELIKTIEHTNGSGDEYWYQVTSSNQIIVSGIYIAVFTDKKTGQNHIAKFAVIR